MNYETFKSSALDSIQTYFGNSASVSLQPIIKNNDTILDGLTIQDRSTNLAPTLYLNYYYEDYLAGKSLSDILDDIIASYRSNLPAVSMDLSFFTDYEKIKFRVIYKLISHRENTELLKDVPHFRFLDLAIVFCCYLPDMADGNASILIHNHHLDFWNLTADSLYELAVKNTPILLPYELKSMEDTLKSLGTGLRLFPDNANGAEDSRKIYVLSNTEKLYGASCLLYPNVLSYFAESSGSDFYIIPSSVHEALLLPKTPSVHASGLNKIIQEVNASQLLKEEVLSDHVYVFERAFGFLTF